MLSLEGHQEHAIINEVEVLNGQAFSNVLLAPRIEPLLKARTVAELVSSIDPVTRSLGVFGFPKFSVDLRGAGDGPALPLKTIVDLRLTHPSQALAALAITSTERNGARAQYRLFNKLGLAETLEVSGLLQSGPYQLGSGSTGISIPMPIGAGRFFLDGFFLNEDRPWSSHAFASHGLSSFIEVPAVHAENVRTQFGCEVISRNVHSIADGAADAVRKMAGRNLVKVAAVARLLHPIFDLNAEIAGGPGDARHVKAWGSLAHSLHLGPYVSIKTGASAGYIHGNTSPLDNFYIGGASRGFYGFEPNTVGSHDGNDCLGGQSFWRGSAAFLFALPWRKLSALRLTGLVNAAGNELHQRTDAHSNIKKLLNTLPTVGVAGGFTYLTSPAEFELLYEKPITGSSGAITREGWYLGVSLSLE